MSAVVQSINANAVEAEREQTDGFNLVIDALKLNGLNKRIKDLLQITKLYTVFDVYDEEATALRSFKG